MDSGMQSSSSRPLRLQMRADLQSSRQAYQGRDYWVVKDPVALKYYRFEEEEFALLQMMDGTLSPDRIKQQFDKRFSPQKITLQELFQFIGLLYRSSLLVSDAPGQGDELKTRGEDNRRRQLRSNWTNVLALRFRGFDPGQLLSFLCGIFGWFFTIPALLFVMAYALGAGLLVATQWEVFQTKLPQFQEFFAVNNWLLLAVTLAITKVCHELGHGIACRRFGGQCHEMGVMFLVLTPCLYCNVSDSWMLPSKWKRAAIAAAGMYVEFFLAATATYVWWWSQPGVINHLALNVIFVCSVSTLLFNANPLLRYDGYYILSDLLEVPNLRQKAGNLIQRILSRWILGLKAQTDPFLPTKHRWFFCIYSIAAVVYRWLITLTIFWFLYQVLEPYGLKIIGQLIALMAIYGLVAMPMIQFVRFIRVPGKVASVKKLNLGIATIAILLAIVGILSIPLPHYVYCSLYVQDEGAQKIYVDVPGNITSIHVEKNEKIDAGQPILKIENVDLRMEIAELESLVAMAKVEYKNAIYVATHESERAIEIDQALANYQSLQSQLEQKKLELTKLEIHSPSGGIVRFPPDQNGGDKGSGQLPTWSGAPLDPQNVGAHLIEGSLVCEIVPENSKQEAVLALDETDLEFIRNGQDVELMIEQSQQTWLQSKIQTISHVEMKVVPKGIATKFGGSVPTKTVQGKEQPLSSMYQVKVSLAGGRQFLPGATGMAKIRAGNRTVGQRLWRIACETFHFRL